MGDKKNIPVFLHIPKCAGIYVRSCLLSFLRRYCWYKYREVPKFVCGYIEVGHFYSAPVKKKQLVSTIGGAHIEFAAFSPISTDFIAYVVFKSQVPEQFRVDGLRFSMTHDEFLNMLESDDLDVFAAVVTSEMLANNSFETLAAVNQLVPYNLTYFASVKTPFERALSMYYVHKQQGDSIPSMMLLPFYEYSFSEFKSFLLSSDSEPGWVTKFLVEALGDDLSAVDFLAYPIQRINELLFRVFSDAYDLEVIPEEVKPSENGILGYPKVNETSIKYKYKLEDLSFEENSRYLDLHSEDLAVIDFLQNAPCCKLNHN